ncbi:hypothetical protein THTE_0190 [Thermogutta terrifontis]|uniref:Uncharacterized protein n=1 Tax=Thermogutta terrifontis TaxID=1331910 RepID=A0A286RA03_9BACT|nr:hypothetical protein THTE_0190 [Thermogutta terrifontis]
MHVVEGAPPGRGNSRIAPTMSEGPACQVRFFGGPRLSGPPLGKTRLSGPSFNVRSSAPLQRGLKSRAESGAKAPHSIQCGDLSPLFSEGFSLHNLTVDPDVNGVPVGWKPFLQSMQWMDAFTVSNRDAFNYSGHDKRAPPRVHWTPWKALLPVGAIHELPLQCRRDPLVGSDEHRLMTHAASPGTTSVPLRNFGGTPLGGTCLSGPFFRRAPLVGAASWKDPLVGSVIQRSIVRSAAAGTEVPRGKRGQSPALHTVRRFMECGDLSPLFSEGFSLHNLTVDANVNRVPAVVEAVPAIHVMDRRVYGVQS